MSSSSNLSSIDRQMKLRQIVRFLADLEGKDPNDRDLNVLAHKFEAQVFSSSANAGDYDSRMNKKLGKVAAARKQQIAIAQQSPPPQGSKTIANNQGAISGGISGGISNQRVNLTHQTPHPFSTQSGSKPLSAQMAQPFVSGTGQGHGNVDSNFQKAAWAGNSEAQKNSFIRQQQFSTQQFDQRQQQQQQQIHATQQQARQQHLAAEQRTSQQNQYTHQSARPAMNLQRQVMPNVSHYQSSLGGKEGISVPSSQPPISARMPPAQQKMSIGTPSSAPNPQQTAAGASAPAPPSVQKLSDFSDSARVTYFGELRNKYERMLLDFATQGTLYHQRVVSMFPSEPHRIEQANQILKYVEEARNSVVYMERCHMQKHVPSDISLERLKHTLQTVLKVREYIQSAARKKPTDSDGTQISPVPTLQGSTVTGDQALTSRSLHSSTNHVSLDAKGNAPQQASLLTAQRQLGSQLNRAYNSSNISPTPTALYENNSHGTMASVQVKVSQNIPKPQNMPTEKAAIKVDHHSQHAKIIEPKMNASRNEDSTARYAGTSANTSLNVPLLDFSFGLEPVAVAQAPPARQPIRLPPDVLTPQMPPVPKVEVRSAKLEPEIALPSGALLPSDKRKASLATLKRDFDQMQSTRPQTRLHKEPRMISIGAMNLNCSALLEKPSTSSISENFGNETRALLKELASTFENVFEFRSVLSKKGTLTRLHATFLDSFHVCIGFDFSIPPKPCDVSVVTLDEVPREKIPGSYEAAMCGGSVWPHSEHEVYEQISAYAFQVLHSMVNDDKSTGFSNSVLVSFLTWIQSYRGQFHDVCAVTGKLLALSTASGLPVPPTIRSLDGQALFPHVANSDDDSRCFETDVVVS